MWHLLCGSKSANEHEMSGIERTASANVVFNLRGNIHDTSYQTIIKSDLLE